MMSDLPATIDDNRYTQSVDRFTVKMYVSQFVKTQTEEAIPRH